MKNIRRLALMVSLCLLTVLSLGIVLFAASACQPAEQSETLDGTYYADVNGEEYTVAFSIGDSYAFTWRGMTARVPILTAAVPLL